MVENANLDEFEKGETPEPDTVQEAVITEVLDGQVKDFVKDTKKWDNPDGFCLHITAETNYKGLTFFVNQIFNYSKHKKKKIWGARSNLGKFHVKYKSLPKIGLKIKVMANKDGFFKLLFKE